MACRCTSGSKVKRKDYLRGNERNRKMDGSRKYILKYSAFANALARGSRVVGKIEEAQGQGSQQCLRLLILLFTLAQNALRVRLWKDCIYGTLEKKH